MALLKIEDAVHKHEGDKLLPVKSELIDWPVEDDVVEIEAIPFMPSEVEAFQRKLGESKKDNQTEEEFDKEKEEWFSDILIEKITKPKFTKVDIKFLKPLEQASIIKTLMVISGVPKERISVSVNKKKQEIKDEKTKS